MCLHTSAYLCPKPPACVESALVNKASVSSLIKFFMPSCFAGAGPADELTAAAWVAPSVATMRWTYVCSSIRGRSDEGGSVKSNETRGAPNVPLNGRVSKHADSIFLGAPHERHFKIARSCKQAVLLAAARDRRTRPKVRHASKRGFEANTCQYALDQKTNSARNPATTIRWRTRRACIVQRMSSLANDLLRIRCCESRGGAPQH